jgi:hypothetical protein
MSNEKETEKFTLSHLGMIRVFVIWGLMEAIIYYVTNGDKTLELKIHIVLFVIFNIIAFKYPQLIKYL